ncbi:hypothetical protein E9840_07050 [Tissierella creatinini]|nr:hypothetical protein E9840_07050 [Tissierella creatinini]TJX62493.1 hypothetical protein E8P77_17005 [Soehngenia saccharolytica]
MRKRLIFLLVAILLGGLQLNAYGETAFNKEMEAVIFKVKSLFSISDGYDTFDSSISSSGNKVYFYLNWSDSTNKMDNISVSADSKGNIISFNKYNPNYIQPDTKLPKYSQSQALQIAKDFIKKVDPNNVNNIKLIENNEPIRSSDNDYVFNFIRLVNSIPYPDNNINISMNKFTGEINNYYANWDRDIEFPSTSGIISMEAGKGAYRDKIGLELIYKSSFRTFKDITTGKDTKYFLAYGPLDGIKVIDAFTGAPINIGYYGNGGAAEEKDMAASSNVITPEERAEIDKVIGIMDVEDLEPKAREILGLDSGYILQGKNLFNDYKNPGDYIWSMYFIKKVDNESKSGDISFNAKTGELMSFYKYNSLNSNSKPVLSKEESLKMAKAYLEKAQPSRVNSVELVEDKSNDGQLNYFFRFVRKIDEIYVETDGISIGVDAVNKEVNSYGLDWFRGELPPKGNTISIDKAYDILFKDIGFELKYAAIYDYEKPDGENKEIKLVYAVNTNKPSIIEAHSGEILDYSGIPYKKSSVVEYTDINDSNFKEEIQTLAQYGVAFSSDKFMPKEKIKQKDFIYLLYKSINSYGAERETDIEKIYDDLVRSNIIREGDKNPERIITKEEAVKFVIRAMNYSKVAEIPDIYGKIFKDSKSIEADLKGHMNIAYGLGIIKVDASNNIKPKAELNRENAASIIYKYMFN